MLLIVGDSHAQACFQGFPGAHVEAINGRTAWRVANNGIDDVPFSPHSDDTVVWLFGEVDCRCHLRRVADRGGHDVDDVVAILAKRYVRRIALYPGRHVVCSVVPAADVDMNRDYPTYGDIHQRVYVTRKFNEFLACRCLRNGIAFCDYHAAFATPGGWLDASLSDGNVHVATEHNGACRDALERCLKVSEQSRHAVRPPQ